MNILLPYEDFEESAKALDDGTLIDQVEETYSALIALTNFPKRPKTWIRALKNYVPALGGYCFTLCQEALNRGLECNEYDTVKEILETLETDELGERVPELFRDPEFHRQSRTTIINKVAYEYVRANAVRKAYKRLGLTVEEAETMLKNAKRNYHWYDNHGWREE